MRAGVFGAAALSLCFVLLAASSGRAQSPPPSAPPPSAPAPLPGFVPPYEITKIVRSAGFSPLAPPRREGTTYVLRATDFRGILMRVVVDARSGAIRAVNRIVPPGPYGAVMAGPYGEPPPYGYGPPPYGAPPPYGMLPPYGPPDIVGPEMGPEEADLRTADGTGDGTADGATRATAAATAGYSVQHVSAGRRSACTKHARFRSRGTKFAAVAAAATCRACFARGPTGGEAGRSACGQARRGACCFFCAARGVAATCCAEKTAAVLADSRLIGPSRPPTCSLYPARCTGR